MIARPQPTDTVLTDHDIRDLIRHAIAEAVPHGLPDVIDLDLTHYLHDAEDAGFVELECETVKVTFRGVEFVGRFTEWVIDAPRLLARYRLEERR